MLIGVGTALQTSQAKVRKLLKGLREFGGCSRTRTYGPLIKSQCDR